MKKILLLIVFVTLLGSCSTIGEMLYYHNKFIHEPYVGMPEDEFKESAQYYKHDVNTYSDSSSMLKQYIFEKTETDYINGEPYSCDVPYMYIYVKDGVVVEIQQFN